MNSVWGVHWGSRGTNVKVSHQARYLKETPRLGLVPRDLGLSSLHCRSCFHTYLILWVSRGGPLALGLGLAEGCRES